MAKTFEFTFSINGLVSQGFTGSMNTARNGLIQLRQQGKELQNKLKELDAALYKNEIDFEGYAAKANKAREQLKALELQQSKLNGVISAKNNLKSAVTDLGAFGIGVYAASRPIVGMIETAASFEQGMSKVKANSRASAEDMGLLTKQAKDLGRTTQFTARQSADAMSYLGMAGWNAQEILKGMPGLLDLAAAGNTDLARTADIVSDELSAFGMGADQAGHMADVFAYTITRTNTNVEMLGETMKYAAPVAHAFGVDMEETAALAGLMADKGIKASQAGTSLRTGFLRLAGPPKQASKAMEALGMDMSEMSKQQAEAQAAMKGLGIELSDTKGPRKMSAIITELRDKLQGLSQEERLASVGAIFGKNASTGWLAVIDSAPDKFDALVKEMDKCDGESKRLAKTMTDNASGAMIRLKSAMEGVAIGFGSAFLPMLADAGDGLANLASSIAEVAEEHPELIKGIGLVTAAMVGAVGAFKVARVAYAAYRVVAATLGFIHLSNAAATATATAATVAGTGATAAATAGTWAFNAALMANPIGLIVVGIAGLIAAGYALYKNWDKVSAGLVKGWEWVKTTAVGVYNWFGQTLSELPQKAGYAVGYVVGWFLQIPDKLMGIIGSLDGVGQSFIDKAKEWGKLGFNGIIDAFLGLPGKLTSLVSNAWESAKSAIGSFTVGFSQGVEAGGSSGAVAANAKGGIYSKGAFLTTFAEESPEAAIPIDGSKRAKNLWLRTGQMLGMVQPTQKTKQNYSGLYEQKPAEMKVANYFTMPGIVEALKNRFRGQETQGPNVPPVINMEQATAPVSVGVQGVSVEQEPGNKPQVMVPEAKPVTVAMPPFPEIPAPVVNATAAAPGIVVNPETPDVNVESPAGPVIRMAEQAAPAFSPIINAMVHGEQMEPAPIVKQDFDSPFRILEDFMKNDKAVESPAGPVNITYSPNNVFNISGSDVPEKIRQTAERVEEMSMAKFREMIQRWQNEQRRVNFG